MEADVHALKIALAAVAAAGAVHAGAAQTQNADPMYTMAMTHYAAGRYAQAATALRESASRGNMLAAETLGFMLYFGDTMYGGAIATNRQQGLRWLMVAARAGRERARQFVEQPGVRGAFTAVRRP
jgi:TPR repeat protein